MRRVCGIFFSLLETSNIRQIVQKSDKDTAKKPRSISVYRLVPLG
jgi:hypothetical protein